MALLPHESGSSKWVYTYEWSTYDNRGVLPQLIGTDLFFKESSGLVISLLRTHVGTEWNVFLSLGNIEFQNDLDS